MAENNVVHMEIEGQHNSIKVQPWDQENGLRSDHPDAQWFPKAGLGLFVHWGISSVNGIVDLSWGMVTGWDLVRRDLSPEQIEEMNRRRCYRDCGFEVTPNEYYEQAKEFKAEHYDPREWLRLGKEAGFTYAVLTTRHHDGFALWPSKYGNFSTKNYLEGRDLVREFVDACREFGIRVGLYYSPPDWYFNKDYTSFMAYTAKRKYNALPELDADYNPMELPSPEVMEKQNRKYGEYVAGQIEELLTEYGKIDLMWFDGSMPDGYRYPLERIRELQPGIVVNPRMHGAGDFENREVKEADSRPKGWWEFCTQWAQTGWGYLKGVPYRPLWQITSEFVRTLCWGGNYLLNVGPKPDGTLSDTTKDALHGFTSWHNRNSIALAGLSSLPEGESCTVPAAKKGYFRFFYLLPGHTGEVLFQTKNSLLRAYLLDDGFICPVRVNENGFSVDVPEVPADQAVRVVCIEMGEALK